MPNHLEKC